LIINDTKWNETKQRPQFWCSKKFGLRLLDICLGLYKKFIICEEQASLFIVRGQLRIAEKKINLRETILTFYPCSSSIFFQGSLTEGEGLSTVDLLVLTSLDQLIFIMKILLR
jgi:hypothetical protein